MILGGLNNRYLPEELYDPKTGTSETAVLMEKAVGGPSGDTAVSIEDRPEEPSRAQSRLGTLARKLDRRWGS